VGQYQHDVEPGALKRSLDDVVKKVYEETYASQNRGYTDREFEAACVAAVGLRRHVLDDNRATLLLRVPNERAQLERTVGHFELVECPADVGGREAVQPHGDLDRDALAELDAAARRIDAGPEMWRHRRKDGTEFEAEISASLLIFPDGTEARLVLSLDVSDRVQAPRDRQEYAARFENAFEGATIGMAIIGLDGMFV